MPKASRSRQHRSRGRRCLQCRRSLSETAQWRNECPYCGARLLLMPEQRQRLHAAPAAEPAPLLPETASQSSGQPCLNCGAPLASIDQWRNQCPRCGMKLLLRPPESPLLGSPLPPAPDFAIPELHGERSIDGPSVRMPVQATGRAHQQAAVQGTPAERATGTQPTPADQIVLFSSPDPAYARPTPVLKPSRVRRLLGKLGRSPVQQDETAGFNEPASAAAREHGQV